MKTTYTFKDGEEVKLNKETKFWEPSWRDDAFEDLEDVMFTLPKFDQLEACELFGLDASRYDFS